MPRLTRRELIEAGLCAGAVAAGLPFVRAGDAFAQSPPPPARRTLGRTGVRVGLVSLGGEGALRSEGRWREATAVIEAAIAAGVTYCDTAPAYLGSRDYYGAVFRSLGAPASRDRVFLASKTAERGRDGSLRVLDDTLARMNTDHLDLWQLHDLRTMESLDRIFARGGAMEALARAREERRVRFLGITGHEDPAVLVEAMRRFPFDTVLLPVNPADPAFLPFLTTAVPEARRRGMGVIGMKVLGRGRLVGHAGISAAAALSYALSRDVDTVIVGCSTPAEVRANIAVGDRFVPLGLGEMADLERRTTSVARRIAFYKRGA